MRAEPGRRAASAAAAMGVPGLTGFVEESGSFFAELRVRDTKLVIDGSSLYYHLFFGSAADFRRGGDYGPFAAAADEFFAVLRSCGVAAFVVLDGGRGAADRKLGTLRERAAERLRAAHGLSRGEGGRVLPLLARHAFVQALRRAAVPFAQCWAEADREVAALANRWGCPVLSLDSDFFIFQLAGGYCPLSAFRWRDVRAERAGRYVPARRFEAESFCRHFGRLRSSALPLFAVVSGNDYVDAAAFEGLLGKVRLPGKHGRARGLLRWLAAFAGPEEAADAVLKHVGGRRRDAVRELLRDALRDYAPSDANLEQFFAEGRYRCEEAEASGLPPWLLGALARGELAPLVANVLTLRSTFLHVQVEDLRRPSAHGAALPIRRVLYGLLLLRAAPGAEARSCAPPAVCEFDRVQKSIKKTFVQAASLPAPFGDDGFTLDKLVEVPMSRRQLLLLETLGVKMSLLESVPSHLQLPVAVTCYWTRCSEPKVNLHHLKALLLMMVSGELHRITNEPVLHPEDNRIAYNEFLKWKEEKLQNKDFDLDAAHSFCQWQCCLEMGLYLNQLLCRPLPEPDLARLYSGTLVHGLYQELKSTPSVENLFSSSPKMTELYQVLLNTVISTVSPDFFQKKTEAKSESCKKKKASKKTKAVRCAVSETRDVNRFASLSVDD
ncbi:protein asteroid homolog 1 [Phasianus colchicus]|uniref:Asteroid homolog 1 n=1 Tax=Phasianus colchicus TaxID=9054 RepID=A0A669P7K9_PHACC|nr:protein asteroid homolog 1 [Phasianus colchicus]